MTARTPTYLKGRFENGDTPSGTDFEDLCDSYIPVLSSGKITINNPVEVSGDFTAQRIWADTITASALNVNSFNTTLVSASIVNTNLLNAQSVSASTITAGSITSPLIQGTVVSGVNVNGNTVSANVVNANVGNITTVSASIMNTEKLNALIVSASIGRFTTVSAGLVNCIYVQQGIQASVSASGTAEGQGTIVSAAYGVIINASANARVVKLETFRPGFRQTIINDTATTCDIYPPNGVIDDASVLQVFPSAKQSIVHIATNQYYSGV